MAWRVIVKDGKRWRDSGEGPFPCRQSAADFARAEVGVSWKLRQTRKKKTRQNPNWKPGKWIKASAVRVRKVAGRVVMDIKKVI